MPGGRGYGAVQGFCAALKHGQYAQYISQHALYFWQKINDMDVEKILRLCYTHGVVQKLIRRKRNGKKYKVPRGIP